MTVLSALLVAAITAIALLAAGIVYQSAGLARDASRYPPPGQLVDVGGYRLHAVCRGEGAPGVVLDAAIAASSLSWVRVQQDVARFTRVCAYDRAGLAWSDAPPARRTFAQMVDDLHTLLSTVDCAPPRVMVGHSFGAFVCLAYAARYRQHVRGLVLVDPPSEWIPLNRRQRQLVRGAVQMSRFGALLARVGVVRACLGLLTGGAPSVPRYFVKVFGPMTARTLERLVGEVRKLPSELHPIVQAHWCRPKCFLAMADQLRALPDAIAQVSEIRTLGDLPMVVVSSGDQPPSVTAMHHALARLSSHGRVVLASQSGHWVPYDEPALIVDAIRQVSAS